MRRMCVYLGSATARTTGPTQGHTLSDESSESGCTLFLSSVVKSGLMSKPNLRISQKATGRRTGGAEEGEGREQEGIGDVRLDSVSKLDVVVLECREGRSRSLGGVRTRGL